MGLNRSRTLRKREEALLEFKRLLQAFKTGIGYTARPISELIAENRDLQICAVAAQEPAALTSPKAALLGAGKLFFRNPADISLFTDFVNGLGESDTQGQLEHIALTAELLETKLTDAADDKAKKSRVYVCVGLFSGITLCLVLL